MMEFKGRILVADDERPQREILVSSLLKSGYEVSGAASLPAAISLFETASRSDKPFNLVVTDLRMPTNKEGLELLLKVRNQDPKCEVILATAFASSEVAFQSGEARAFAFLEKPLDFEKTMLTIESAVEKSRLAHENKRLRSMISKEFGFSGIIGKHPGMVQLFERIERVSATGATCLIRGESGTGKELVAKAIHDLSPRKDDPFVAINCAAIPPNLIESELYGHEKGVFTGAVSRRSGRFEDVGDGTLFLDEIGAMDLELQPKLLRSLQELEFSRVGSSEIIPFGGRIVAATGRDLLQAVEAGEFREDLFFRLNVVVLEIPPLRNRKEDIPLLVEHFLLKGGLRHDREFSGITGEVMEIFDGHSWPGNVRELENCLERMMVLGEGSLLGEDLLPPGLRGETDSLELGLDSVFNLPSEGIVLEELEKNLIEQALMRSDGKLEPAAKMLGITYKTLQYRIRKYRLKENPEGQSAKSE
ncbi:MAG: response regulator [Planctomycetia bacterium]|jgi:two-component system, NtrC family, response regulator PilR|nr:response regulator [Planctomycetia bacterium]NCG12095.1 response regulator [Planctomycetia bacterium]